MDQFFIKQKALSQKRGGAFALWWYQERGTETMDKFFIKQKALSQNSGGAFDLWWYQEGGNSENSVDKINIEFSFSMIISWIAF